VRSHKEPKTKAYSKKRRSKLVMKKRKKQTKETKKRNVKTVSQTFKYSTGMSS
jgi:predicted double-glycine peptidase